MDNVIVSYIKASHIIQECIHILIQENRCIRRNARINFINQKRNDYFIISISRVKRDKDACLKI